MMTKRFDPIVFVVDDDEAVRSSIALLVRSLSLRAETFASAQEFLDDFDAEQPGCIVLDVRMPGMSGLELQETLAEMGAIIPIIFITAHGDVPMAVGALKGGAMDFIQKPFRDQDLIDKIQAALSRDAENRDSVARCESIESRIGLLTPREREVMELVVEGKANKVIAAELGLSERTVEIHRGRVMTKMLADSLPHLVEMALLVRDQD
jgi:FixJ family two-component response regulator